MNPPTLAPPAAYYHGGPIGIRIGGYILPPAETGAKHTLLAAAKAAGLATPATDREVYVTTDPAAALFFASSLPKGTVYIVEPEGELREDLDCDLPGLSFACDRARVVGRLKLMPYHFKRARRAIVGATRP